MKDRPTLEAAMQLADQDCPLPLLAGKAMKVLRDHIIHTARQRLAAERFKAELDAAVRATDSTCLIQYLDCKECSGTGVVEDLDGNDQLCAVCEGTGSVQHHVPPGFVLIPSSNTGMQSELQARTGDHGMADLLDDLATVVRLSARATPGPIELHTSCSWRRLVSVADPKRVRPFLSPTVDLDGHPNLDTLENAEFVVALVNFYRDHEKALIDAANYWHMIASTGDEQAIAAKDC